MTYQKLLIDNTTCSRRFHLTYDTSATHASKVEVRCQLCDAVIFQSEDHPPVTLARVENLVKTSTLSDHLVSECHFEDTLSKRTIKSTTKSVQP